MAPARRPFVFCVLAALPVVLGSAAAPDTPEAEAPRGSRSERPAGRPPVVLAEPFDPERALEVVYQDEGERVLPAADAGDPFVRWRPSAPATLDRLHEGFDGYDAFRVTVGSASRYRRADAEHVLLVGHLVPDGEEPWDCHACAGGLSVADFVRRGERWELVAANRYVTAAGSHGRAPDGEPIRLGPERWGALFESAFLGQGHLVTSFVLVTGLEDVAREALVARKGEDNRGACDDPAAEAAPRPAGGDETIAAEDEDEANADAEDAGTTPCFAFDSTLAVVPGRNAEWGDVRITTTGTEPDASTGALRRADRTATFVYDDGVYRLVPPDGAADAGGDDATLDDGPTPP